MNQTTTPQTAVALRYDGSKAPTVSATGTHELAEEIIRIAREHGVPLYENPELAGILGRLELDEEIPETLYRVIAEILAFAFNLQGKTPEDAGGAASTGSRNAESGQGAQD
ncbi:MULTISPECIES: EscU/YscU/HrcU family type III secretion system export apparatus switch protein [Marinobacter]|uniref:EscU/YscU/HrcU family type III secretion system export apparatus switch protein n=1 Tax=Marinobacter TaxID=2742 RepID=UPI001D071D2B|nr:MULTISPECIES: EscU/YscU/HrcU family type III secretion system export apparatus switch protein [Marinobacter]MCK7566583.1 EscU/YscU/HrcU family type III secretion system export apparatus switch protein [Marinobacter xestospongiae]UDL06704.1 EscU/YscU/HrcU family type III secretion system export apparatus switch protein [Marinobacter sp. CA1]